MASDLSELPKAFEILRIAEELATDVEAPPNVNRLARAYLAQWAIVAEYIAEATNDSIGTGEDPWGFVIASHRILAAERAKHLQSIRFARIFLQQASAHLAVALNGEAEK